MRCRPIKDKQSHIWLRYKWWPFDATRSPSPLPSPPPSPSLQLPLLIPATATALQPSPPHPRTPLTWSILSWGAPATTLPCHHHSRHTATPATTAAAATTAAHRHGHSRRCQRTIALLCSFMFRFWLSQSMTTIADSLALVCSSGLRSWLVHAPLTWSILTWSALLQPCHATIASPPSPPPPLPPPFALDIAAAAAGPSLF